MLTPSPQPFSQLLGFTVRACCEEGSTIGSGAVLATPAHLRQTQ